MSTIAFSLKMVEYMNTYVFSFNKFNCCTQDGSTFPVKSILSLCAQEAPTVHITLVMPQIVGLRLKITFSMSTEKMYSFCNQCENSLIVLDSTHNQLKYLNVGKKNTLSWREKK